jgi:hypothetical protein
MSRSGTFNLNADGTCYGCPSGAVCRTPTTVTAKQDYWRDPSVLDDHLESVDAFYRCQPGRCCPDGGLKPGGDRPGCSQNNTCALNRRGVLCESEPGCFCVLFVLVSFCFAKHPPHKYPVSHQGGDCEAGHTSVRGACVRCAEPNVLIIVSGLAFYVILLISFVASTHGSSGTFKLATFFLVSVDESVSAE